MQSPSSLRFRDLLAAHPSASQMCHSEALYNLQVRWTCELLEIMDTATDSVTAAMITDLIFERVSGDGASEAAQRQRSARAERERMYATDAKISPLIKAIVDL